GGRRSGTVGTPFRSNAMSRGKLCVGLALVAALAALGTWASPLTAGKPVSEARIKKITAALPESAPAKPAKARKILIFTLAKGFVHSSIPVGAKALQMMGEKTGAYDAVISNDLAMFEPDKLKDFDAIVMVSTTGELFGKKAKKDDPLEAQAKNERLRLSL